VAYPRLTSFAKIKEDVNVGIFGSYRKPYKSELRKLRDFLVDNKYNAKIAQDLPSILDDDGKEDRWLQSKQLIDYSRIHIFIFHFEKEDDPRNLMQMVSIELGLIEERKKPNVLVLCEEGLRDGISGSFSTAVKDLLHHPRKLKNWEVEDYTSFDSDIFECVLMFCRRCLLDEDN
jgi:hypothetical protein